MFNTRVTILPIFLALVLIYLVVGDCTLLKLLLAGISGFLIYINFLPAKEAACRSNDCIVSPVNGKVTDIVYQDDKVYVTIFTKLYDKAIVTMPKNDYVHIASINGAVLDCKLPTAKKLNQKIVYTMSDCTMTLLPQYFEASNYAKNDRYYIGDMIGRLFCGEVVFELQNYDVKIALGDTLQCKNSVIAYRNDK
jgi:hypothetical protein